MLLVGLKTSNSEETFKGWESLNFNGGILGWGVLNSVIACSVSGFWVKSEDEVSDSEEKFNGIWPVEVLVCLRYSFF